MLGINIEAFWDGNDCIVFGVAGLDSAEVGADRAELAVLVSPNEDEKGLVAAFLKQRGTIRQWHAVRLPRPQGWIRIYAANDIGGQTLARFDLRSGAPDHEGDWRAAVALVAPETEAGAASTKQADSVSVPTRPALGPDSSFIEEVIARNADRLVWGCIQRAIPLQDRTTRLLPARHIWPMRTQITIEVWIEEEQQDNSSGATAYQANEPAIMKYAKRERPPRANLKLSINTRGRKDKSFLDRVVLIHRMNQRRHMHDLNATLCDNHKPEVRVLEIGDALGVLNRDMPELNLVRTPNARTLTNLGAALRAAHTQTGVESLLDSGIAIVSHDPPQIEFFGATLGDDIGLACSYADERTLHCLSNDPGGIHALRLFRWTGLGLEPRAVQAENGLDRELLLAAQRIEAWPEGSGPETHDDVRRWTRFCAARNLAESPGFSATRAERLLSEDIGGLLLTAWADLVAATPFGNAPGLSALTGFANYLSDPAMVAGIRHHEWPEPASAITCPAFTEAHLPARIAAALGFTGLIGDDLSASDQDTVWRILTNRELLRGLTEARLSIGTHDRGAFTKIAQIATILCDENRVRQIANACTERGDEQNAGSLKAYLRKRREGQWTALTEAATLAGICERIDADRQSLAQQLEAIDVTVHPIAEPLSFEDMLRRVEDLAKSSKAQHGPAQRIAREFFDRQKAKQLDTQILQSIEAALRKLLGIDGEDALAVEICGELEKHAGLQGFLQSMEKRLRGSQRQRRPHELVDEYVSRVKRSTPALDAGTGPLAATRRALEDWIRHRLEADGGGRKEELLKLFTAYGDVLLFHRAYKQIESLLEETPGHPRVARVRRGLRAWPSNAEATWKDADLLAAAAKKKFGEKSSQPIPTA